MFQRFFALAMAVSVLPVYTHAQKQQYTIAEATNGMATTLATKGLRGLNWQPGANTYWETIKKDSTDIWKATRINNNGNTPNIVSTEVIPTSYPDGVTIKGLPNIKWASKMDAWFVDGTKVVLGKYLPSGFAWTTVVKTKKNAENITVGKSQIVAFTVDNNIWISTPENDNIRVTAEPENVICGKPVHRDEFGIDRGLFFSPKGNLLAYYRMDQRMVNDYPVVLWDKTPATAKIIKYPMAGGRSHEVTLCVYNPSTESTITLKTGDKHPDHYLTSVTWSPDEKHIYLAILNREQNHLWLNRYNATTGEKEATLFEETDEKYVHPTHSLYFIPGNDNQFVWWSQRDGYEHLYLYNTDGKLVKQLTKGKWVVNELCGYNKNNKQLVITTSMESPLEKHIYTLNLQSSKLHRIDEGAGMHTAIYADDNDYLIDVYNGPGVPKNTVLRSLDGGESKELLKSPDPLSGYDRPEIRNITVTAADGVTPLFGKLVLPTHFDSTRKYPVIVYLYNGPNVQLLHNSFPESGNLWYEYMAQHGYIVFTMDGRGSWNRGLTFEQATFRHLGDVEMDDQLKGVAYLKKLKYVDTARMGVHGWSFGGFMTTSLMLRHPGVFKCAVAGGPVMDWSMYEVMYTERYMDTPDENPVGYAKNTLLDKVKNLQGKLLLIHGTNDDVVVWQHSIDFIRKSVEEGVQVDYFVYPGHEHNVRGKDRVHLMQKITNYFDDYLAK